MNPREFAADYFNRNPNCELTGDPGHEVHHIFGKWNDALRYNDFNLCTLVGKKHYRGEFISVQEVQEEIFEKKIEKLGQPWIDYANKHGGKTWRVYREKKGI